MPQNLCLGVVRAIGMNILMIMADQLAADVLGAYGHAIVRTPHIDALAAAGTLFENCYCNSPLCVPSRQSMVTGRLPGGMRFFDNGSELPAGVPTLMHHLRIGGFRTILAGKMHFVGPDQLHGFEERLTPDIYPASFEWTPDWGRGTYGNPGASVKKLQRSGLCAASEQIDYDDDVQAKVLERLRQLGRQGDDRPFFLCVSYTHPHDPFVITAEYWDRYADCDIEAPAAPAQPIDSMHPYNQWIQIHHEMDKYPPTPQQISDSRRAYYGMVSYVDDKVGELLAELDRLGLCEDTLVIFTSDHGEMLGEHGMWFKRTFYEGSSRVPMIVCKPGAPAGLRERAVVSLVDLFPTLLNLAGLPAAKHRVDGMSFASALDGKLHDWKDSALCEYYGEGILQPMRFLRQGRYKYVYVHGCDPLLFDLAADPLEQHNLAGQAEIADVEMQMREAVLADWDAEVMSRAVLRSQHDRLFICDALAKGKQHAWDFRPES